MNIYERKAEKVILLTYNQGGYIEVDHILKCFDDSYIDENVMQILDHYGKTGVSELESKYGWNWYQLSEKGMRFARNGCFSKEKRDNTLSSIGSIAAIIAAIASIIAAIISILQLST